MRWWILDLDDTLAYTTRDMQGEPLRLPELTLVPGAREFLNQTQVLGDRCVLVTVGEWALQMKKMQHLALTFSRYVILPNPVPEEEPTLFWSANPVFVKKAAFEQLKTEAGDGKVVVVGDRLDRDVAPGNMLGLTTVRMRLPDGKYSLLEPQSPEEVPDFTAANFFELMQLPIFTEQ